MSEISVNKTQLLQWEKALSVPEKEGVAELYKMNFVHNATAAVMSMYLYRAMEEGWWKRYSRKESSYTNFYVWVYHELGVKERKAKYLVAIARKIQQLNVPTQFRESLLLLGWSKAYQVLNVCDNLNDFNKWYRVASHSSERQLRRIIVAYSRDPGRFDVRLNEHNIPFLIDIQNDNEWLPIDEAEELLLELYPPEEEEFIEKTIRFKKSEYAIFEQATTIVRERGVERDANIATILASQYMATCVPSMSGNGKPVKEVDLDMVLAAVEKAYGVRLAVLKT